MHPQIILLIESKITHLFTDLGGLFPAGHVAKLHDTDICSFERLHNLLCVVNNGLWTNYISLIKILKVTGMNEVQIYGYWF